MYFGHSQPLSSMFGLLLQSFPPYVMALSPILMSSKVNFYFYMASQIKDILGHPEKSDGSIERKWYEIP